MQYFRKRLSLRNEASILQRIQHENVVKYIGSVSNTTSFRLELS